MFLWIWFFLNTFLIASPVNDGHSYIKTFIVASEIETTNIIALFMGMEKKKGNLSVLKFPSFSSSS